MISDYEKNNHRISIPSYSLGEELINSISHGIGAGLGIAGLVLMIIQSVCSGVDVAWKVVSSCIFGATIIILYLMSCLYHALKVNMAKRVFRVFDHCTIFLLIAGTYTPFTLVSLRSVKPWLGWTLFGAIWAIAIIGIVLNAVNLKKYAKASVVCYLLMGWMVILAYRSMTQAIAPVGISLLIWGGVVYSVGALVYAIGSRRKYFHSIFHFFCIGGTVLHFFSIYAYVLA